MSRVLLLVLMGCGPTPSPNPDGLSVSGAGGVPVFTWTGREAEALEVVDPETGAPLWQVGPIGVSSAGTCLNLMFPDTDLTWLEPPNGTETQRFLGQDPPPETLGPTEGYEASLSVCLTRDANGATSDNSRVYFDVLEDGAIVMDCDRSLCP